jgi:hypothetical protein
LLQCPLTCEKHLGQADLLEIDGAGSSPSYIRAIWNFHAFGSTDFAASGVCSPAAAAAATPAAAVAAAAAAAATPAAAVAAAAAAAATPAAAVAAAAGRGDINSWRTVEPCLSCLLRLVALSSRGCCAAQRRRRASHRRRSQLAAVPGQGRGSEGSPPATCPPPSPRGICRYRHPTPPSPHSAMTPTTRWLLFPQARTHTRARARPCCGCPRLPGARLPLCSLTLRGAFVLLCARGWGVARA